MAKVDLDRIRQEAATLANRQGLDRLSMNELALALGIRPPSLYAHVSGIDAVKRLLALHGLALLDERAGRAAIGKAGPMAVRGLLMGYREFARANPGVYAATIPTPPPEDTEWRAAQDRLMTTFTACLEAYALNETDLVHALRGLRSLVHGFVAMETSAAFKNPVSRDESFAWLIDSFLASLGNRARIASGGAT
ncbi:MAG: WHG domain-containing protein [Rhodospirillales bacterium]